MLSGTLLPYDDAWPTLPKTHGNHTSCGGVESYAFAAKMPLVPITADEFAAAATHYPIVFFGPERSAYVVTGLTADRNLFVGEDRSYAPGAHIPANLRRYIRSGSSSPPKVISFANKAEQVRHGSRDAYARMENSRGWNTNINDDLAAFIARQNSAFFLQRRRLMANLIFSI